MFPTVLWSCQDTTPCFALIAVGWEHLQLSGQLERVAAVHGVLFLVRDDVQCWRRDDLQFWSESVWIDIKTTSLKSVVLGCVYRPPSSLLTDIDRFEFLDVLNASLERISQRRTHIVVVDDFNATSPQWRSTDSHNATGRRLEPEFFRLGLHQCVDFPTRLRADGNFGSL